MGAFRDRLERFDAGKKGRIPVLAVPSNVGEPAKPAALDTRARSMILFGQALMRKRAYETNRAALQAACERFGIAEVHDVGSLFEGIPERIGDVAVRSHGRLEAAQLSSLLGSMHRRISQLSALLPGQVGSLCGLLRASAGAADSVRGARPAAGR